MRLYIFTESRSSDGHVTDTNTFVINDLEAEALDSCVNMGINLLERFEDDLEVVVTDWIFDENQALNYIATELFI